MSILRAVLLIVAAILFFIAMGIGFGWWDSDKGFGWLSAGLLAVVLADLLPALAAQSAATRRGRTT